MMPVSETEILIAGGINVNSGCILDTKKKRKQKITCDYLKTDQSSAFHIIGENKFLCLSEPKKKSQFRELPVILRLNEKNYVEVTPIQFK